MTVIRKTIKKEKCYCGGKKKKCRACKNTGIYEEHHYLFIDDKQKICMDSDNLAQENICQDYFGH